VIAGGTLPLSSGPYAVIVELPKFVVQTRPAVSMATALGAASRVCAPTMDASGATSP
jgi:hypothetical protein